jgi:uncharacterized protein YdhG (YjbR/CyaY superfamily)
MISKAADVKSYIAEVPEERRAAIKKLRALCRKTLTGYTESMEYGMPCYKRDGVIEVGFASQKHSINVYALKREVVDEFRAALSTASIGKGCIRFSKPDKIDFEVLERLLRKSVRAKSSPC